MYKDFVLDKASTQTKLAVSTGFIFAYFLLGQFGLALAVEPANVTPFYPAAGLAWVAFILYGNRAIVPVFIAGAVTNMIPLLSTAPLVPSVIAGCIIGAGEVLSGLAATKIYFYFREKEPYLRSIHDVVLFCLISIFWVVSPTIGVAALTSCGFVSVEEFRFIWMAWWLGESIGILISAPFLLIAFYKQARLDFSNNFPVTLVFLLIAVAASIIVFTHPYPLLYLLVVICLFAALNLPQLNVIVITIVIAAVGVVSTFIETPGPGHTFSPLTQLWLLQLFIATVTVLPLVFWSVVNKNKIVGKKWMLAENKARLDPLTGVLNRRGFDEQSRKVIEQYKSLVPMCMVLIDIDTFKSVNDDFGHDAGDKVLRSFSRTVQNMIREQDLFARIGGDEFAVVLIGKDLKSALNVAERLRESCESDSVSLSPELEINYTVSVGISQRHQAENDIVDWLKRTDKLLYKAKDSGRNLVVSEQTD